PLRYEWDDHVIKPQYVIQEISNLTHGDALDVTGVGHHQMWAAQYYKVKHPRAWCTAGGLRTVRDGLPTALGVAARTPGRGLVGGGGAGAGEGVLGAGPGGGRRRVREGRVGLPHGAGGGGQQGHDLGSPESRRQGPGGQGPDRLLKR